LNKKLFIISSCCRDFNICSI